MIRLALMALVYPAFATPSPPSVQMRITSGEKVSLFIVTKTPTGGELAFSNSEGAHSNKTLSAEDYKFIFSKVEGFGSRTDDLRFCSRNYMAVFNQKKQTVGCVNSKTKISVELRSLLNVLTLAL